MQKIKNKKIKFIVFFPLDIIITFFGILYFIIFKKNHNFFYQSMIRLFCVTGGYSNKYINKFTSKKSNLNLENNNIKVDKINKIVKKIQKDGYFIYENFLEPNECEEILNFCLKSEFEIRPNDKENWNNEFDKSYFKEKNIKAVMYEIPKDQVFIEKIISDLIFSPEILLICEKYLSCMPIFDHTSLSISTSFSNQPDKKAAQLFHFDLDRPKWLKFLIYINDVDYNNGPHVFVEGSHKDNGIKPVLLSNGYDRIPDELVFKYYNNKVKNFTKKRGTLIIEDTRGLHKGTKLNSGYRCLLNIQFNSSNYGTELNTQEIQKKYINNKIYQNNLYTYQNLKIK